MAVDESKIIDLIARYERYEDECRRGSNAVDASRARLYRTVISELEELLPRKTIADLGVSGYDELTGAIVEYAGLKGVLLGGSGGEVILFTFADPCLVYTEPARVYPLNEERLWDETGEIL